MKLSSKTQYGIRILVQVAQATQAGKLAQGKDIANQQRINEPYLEQIMVLLKKAGLIQTVRGRRGGYMLAEDNKSISLLDIIEVFEGPVSLADSGHDMSTSHGRDAVGRILDDINKIVREETSQITLADIMEADRDLMPDYVI